MALPLRLPTPIADRRSNPPLIVAVEVVALVAGIGALALLSSDQTMLILLGVVLVGGAAAVAGVGGVGVTVPVTDTCPDALTAAVFAPVESVRSPVTLRRP